MKKEKKVWAITLIAFWWLAPNKIHASPQDSVRTLHEVVVTATKFPKNLVETGKSLTIIDETQIQKNTGKDIAQLLNEQVGLIVNGANSNPGKDKSVYLRGAGSQYTLILLDGIPMNDPSGVGGAFDLRMLPLDRVARIEILKGSQSTLYGTDAIAGVINIITKRKGDKPISGFGTLSGGSYRTFRGNAGIDGSMEKFDYHVSFTRYVTDGISEAKDQTGTGNFDKDGYQQNSFQANFGIKPTPQLSIRPFIRYVTFDGKYDAGAFADDPSAVYTSKLLNYGLTGKYDLHHGAINILYGRSETERNFESPFGKYPYRGDFSNAEVFVNHDLGKFFQLLAGVNHQSYGVEDENAVKKNPSANIISPYASFFVKNWKGVSVEFGGRYNNHSVFGNALTYSINPSWLIRQRVKLFINYATGFKAPTLNELYGQYGANDKLKPQESKSEEAGIQFFSADNRFDVRATWFDRRIKNVIIYGATGYINLDAQSDHGFEVEPAMKIDNHLTIRGYYAFVDGMVTTKTFANQDTTYNNLLRRPRHTVGLNVGYQATKRFYASINLKTFGSRKDAFFDLNDFSTKPVTLSAYQLLDAYVEYKLAEGRITLFVNARNILNQDYMESYGYSTLLFNMNGGITMKL